jgi:hypothetical protein
VFALRLSARPLAIVAAAAVLTVAHPAFAQLLRPPTDPQGLQQLRKSPMTLTPSVTVSEEYNDNVFLDNTKKEWDLITRITPGVSFEVGDPTYRLAAGYFFTADLYARHPELNQAFDAHSFIGDALWKVSPRLTLNAFDTFTLTTDTNLVNQESVATGRNRSYSNYMGGGASYLLTPLTSLRGGALWVVQRFQSEDLFDSDTYGIDLALDRTLTPRLTGTVAYEYRFFNIQGLPDTTTHTPRLGVRFRFTETITGSLSAGPTVETGSISRITPAVAASLGQRYGWGNVTVDYSRSVGTSGGLGGTADNQAGGATVQLTSLMPRLVVQGGPRFNSSVSPDHRIDLHGLTLPVQASYRLQTGIAFIAAYQFFRQRSDSLALTPAGTAIATDADQNRMWVGIQFGYPFKFE